jgi:predicted Zn-dependent peptidase
MAAMSRRAFFKGPVAAGLAGVSLAQPARASTRAQRSFQLDNGFTAQVLEADFDYTALLLMLRSKEIMAHDGLAHIIEHTSFVGAAGERSAHDIEEAWKDYVQDSNAVTSPGRIVWTASFLPHHLEHVIELLALTSLDQRFDVPTVAQEKAVVLQELYDDKYDSSMQGRRQFDQSLYGKDHPLARDTTEAEIRKAKMPADELALELREFSKLLRLPANMSLYIAGSLGGHSSNLDRLIACHFGRYAHKCGPLLHMPRVPRTAGYKRLTKHSRHLQRPLCSLEIAWNTGVTIKHPSAAALVLLAEYINSVLFDRIREEKGDSYSPDASFDLCDFAGVFDIYLKTTKDPRRIEKQVLAALADIKQGVGARELERCKERLELNRRRNRRQDDTLLDGLSECTRYGIATDDLDIQSVTVSDVKTVAERYLPSYRGAYIRLAELGTG